MRAAEGTAAGDCEAFRLDRGARNAPALQSPPPCAQLQLVAAQLLPDARKADHNIDKNKVTSDFH